MRKLDAPRAGWYPDPEHRSRLRWWDGLDWTDISRAEPSNAELVAAEDHVDPFRYVATPPPSGAMEGARMSRQESQEIINEVRNVARQELDRAAQEFSNRATTAVRSVTPLITNYTNQLVRWVRRAVIIAIVLLVAYFVFQVIAQASFFEWLGDRIDNLNQSGLGSGPGSGFVQI